MRPFPGFLYTEDTEVIRQFSDTFELYPALRLEGYTSALPPSHVGEPRCPLLLLDLDLPHPRVLDFLQSYLGRSDQNLAILLSKRRDFDFLYHFQGHPQIIRYLVKPLEAERMFEALEAALARFHRLHEQLCLNVLSREELEEYSNFFYCHMRSQIVVEVREGRVENLDGLLSQVVDRLRTGGFSLNLFQRFAIGLICVVNDLITGMGIDLHNMTPPSDALSHIARATDFDPLKAFLIGEITYTVEHVALYRDSHLSPLIAQALDYLERHYDQEDLSLQRLAEALEVSASYLSTRFKSEVGVGFIQYLQSLRIEHAKKLLSQKGFRMYEVAARVGISDVRYFARIFKRAVGSTPSEYRKQVVLSLSLNRNPHPAPSSALQPAASLLPVKPTHI